MLLDCPEEVLVKVFKLVDRQTYTTCLRVRILYPKEEMY
jgi:hypothetical protein